MRLRASKSPRVSDTGTPHAEAFARSREPTTAHLMAHELSLGKSTARGSTARRGGFPDLAVLTFQTPVRVSPRFPGTPPVTCDSL